MEDRPGAPLLAPVGMYQAPPLPDAREKKGTRKSRSTEDDFRPAGRWAKAFSARANILSLWHRPKSNMAELDGLRAWAVLWVVMLHTFLTWVGTHSGEGCLKHFPNVEQCVIPPAFQRLSRHPLMQPAIWGDLGVDIFFVLSGFLIAFILFREQSKRLLASSKQHTLALEELPRQSSSSAIRADIRLTGIDTPRFLFRRWLRLTPAYVTSMLIFSVVKEERASCLKWGWSNLLFINNVVGPDMQHKSCMIHTWSIAVEWQFYLVSPFVVITMSYLHRRFSSRWAAMAVPVLMSIASLVARGMWILWALEHAKNEHVTDWSLTKTYDKVWTRCCPYLAGMAIAFLHHTKTAPDRSPPKKRPFGNLQHCGRILCNIVAVGVWVTVAYLGAGQSTARVLGGEISSASEEYNTLTMVLLWVGRAAFGCSVAYVIDLSLTPGRGWPLMHILRWNVWVPVARLSYSAYLLQYVAMVFIVMHVEPSDTASVWVTLSAFFGLLLCVYVGVFLLAFFCYMAVEKPFMNLR